MKYIIYIIIIFLTVHSMQAQKIIQGKYDSQNNTFITKDTSYWIDFLQGDVARISSNDCLVLWILQEKFYVNPNMI